ncbi:MAG: phage holin family protein [Candidatus Harrisonbacteria bacterium]|nr:phage holin family protein [Candidatus Harrisonbacteria bacterium]
MIRKIILTYLANFLALLAAAYFIPGFDIVGSFKGFLALIGIITLIHLIIRPFIKLALSPIIFLTFGLFNIVINAAILFIIDIYSQNISIDGLLPLLYATLLISFFAFIVRRAGKKRSVEEED